MANAEDWTPVEESASPEQSPTAGWTPVEEPASPQQGAQGYDPRASFMAGIKDFPAALAAMGTVPSYEDFVKRTGGDMHRAMGLVTAAAIAGLGANKAATSRAASRATPPPESPPAQPAGYRVSSTNPEADTFYKPGAPGAPAAPPAPGTAAQRASELLGKVPTYTRPLSYVPGFGWVHPTAEYAKLLADLLVKRGYAQGGEVLSRIPSREETLRSLRLG